jgi:hypothetical protein
MENIQTEIQNVTEHTLWTSKKTLVTIYNRLKISILSLIMSEVVMNWRRRCKQYRQQWKPCCAGNAVLNFSARSSQHTSR